MSWLAEVLPIAVLLLMYTLLWLEKRKVRRATDEEGTA
jgi:hypothetical protein